MSSTAFAAAAVSGLVAGLGVPHLATVDIGAAPSRTAFAGRSFPVRPIEVVAQRAAHARLVRIPCAGAKPGVSSCWAAAAPRRR